MVAKQCIKRYVQKYCENVKQHEIKLEADAEKI